MIYVLWFFAVIGVLATILAGIILSLVFLTWGNEGNDGHPLTESDLWNGIRNKKSCGVSNEKNRKADNTLYGYSS